MNKTSDIAFEVTQDIYALGGEIDKLHEEYGNRHISEQVYFKKLYVFACEATVGFKRSTSINGIFSSYYFIFLLLLSKKILLFFLFGDPQ